MKTILLFALVMIGLGSCERKRRVHEIFGKLDSLTVEFRKANDLPFVERHAVHGDIIILKTELLNELDSLLYK